MDGNLGLGGADFVDGSFRFGPQWTYKQLALTGGTGNKTLQDRNQFDNWACNNQLLSRAYGNERTCNMQLG